MGREVRRVPATWEHPKDARGRFIPMHQHFSYNEEEIAEGLRDGWLENKPPHYGVAVMPDWPEAERTHWQMYETTSEGTPISPVMPTPEALARWLDENKASAFADFTATYDQWLAMIECGWAPSAAIESGVVRSGVEAFGKKGGGTW